MIKLTFECDDSDQAALLITLYDIIKEIPPEESNIIQDYGGYLFDRVTEAIEMVYDYGSTGGLAEVHIEFIKWFRKWTSEKLSSL